LGCSGEEDCAELSGTIGAAKLRLFKSISSTPTLRRHMRTGEKRKEKDTTQ